MRRATYDRKKVICPNSSCIGYSSNVAKPGYWISYKNGFDSQSIARVLGRIASPHDVGGFLAVMRLSMVGTHASIAWVDPKDVSECYEKPPRALLDWITGDDWVKTAGDIARIVAMSEHGTTSESFIRTRNDPEKAYNARPEYVAQFIE